MNNPKTPAIGKALLLKPSIRVGCAVFIGVGLTPCLLPEEGGLTSFLVVASPNTSGEGLGMGVEVKILLIVCILGKGVGVAVGDGVGLGVGFGVGKDLYLKECGIILTNEQAIYLGTQLYKIGKSSLWPKST